jgi:hypothetical protein
MEPDTKRISVHRGSGAQKLDKYTLFWLAVHPWEATGKSGTLLEGLHPVSNGNRARRRYGCDGYNCRRYDTLIISGTKRDATPRGSS